jgi:hypothetical protein
LVFALVGLTGCATVQNPKETGATGQDALAAHVRFLAQPALKGRKAGTKGSSYARRYIEAHFREYGLTPWDRAKSYEWPFERGVNVVGFLPGTDPRLSNQLVLVSAHYDHLGKDKDGLHPGAADNASGVAALLETARRLAKARPNRSMLFVAFDCEEMMLFGSFAFTCEPAVQKAKIAAVVNVDMLGRNFFDVVRHTLFIVGTEGYPNTAGQVRAYGSATGIRVLPLGSDLVGPRGDHAAFEALGVPCLFFSCGSFRDYHQPQDTADKLDYVDVERSTEVILKTVESLANADELERASDARNGYTGELQAIRTVMTEVKEHRDQAGIKAEDAEAFMRLDQEAEQLLAENRLDEKSRRQLATDATGVLAPYLIPQTPGKKPPTPEQQAQLRLSMQCLQEFYSDHHAEVLEGYRKFVAQILKYRPGIVRGMPKFEHSIYDLSNNDISLTDQGQDRHSLNALPTTWIMAAEIKWRKWVLKSFNASIGIGVEDLSCEGTREQLMDYCLLRWHAEQSNAVHAAALRKVLRSVTGDEPCDDFKTQFKQRLHSGGFDNAKDWLVHCIGSDCPQLQLQGLQAAMESRDEDKRLSRAACRLLAGSSVRPDVRASAIDMAVRANSRESLLAVCKLLGDSTPVYKREFVPMLQQDYPFIERAIVKATRQEMERWFKKSPDASKTLGKLAREKLRKVAKRDLGGQEQPWRSWVESRNSLS